MIDDSPFDDPDDAENAAPEMNTTPLIDVLLVLLIMLIVAIPLRPHLTELVQARSAAPSDPPPTVARLAIDADGVVRWEGAVIGPGELETRLDEVARTPRAEIHLRVDGEAAHGRVMPVLSAIRRRESIKFGLVGSGG